MLENIDLCVMLKKRCVFLNIIIPIEPGCEVVFQGQSFRVVAVRSGQLAVVDELIPLPIHETNIAYIQNWQEDDNCVIIPTIEMLLQIIFDTTGFFPTLIPGVEEAREVWKVQHPSAENPYIFKTPNDALLELAVYLLKRE